MTDEERRQFPRLDVPILSRPAGWRGPRRPARNLSRGGISVYVDEPLAVGTRLEIELFLPGGDSVSVNVRVAWIRALNAGDARYDAGLEFLAMDDEHRERLERCLADHELR